MANSNRSIVLSARALREFEKDAGSKWGNGIRLAELLARVNRVATSFLSDEGGRDSRVSRVFSQRSFRHYQTLGCIDPPAKEGKRALYDFRHFVQALLVRKLLCERMPSAQIAALMVGRGTDETRQLLVGGVAMVARSENGQGALASDSSAPKAKETWTRVRVSPGIELHLRDDLPKPKATELKRLLARLETALRRSL